MPSRLIIFGVEIIPYGKLLHLDHLNKEEAIHVDEIINKYSDLFRLPDQPLGHTDVTAHCKIVKITNDRLINNTDFSLFTRTKYISERFDDEQRNQTLIFTI